MAFGKIVVIEKTTEEIKKGMLSDINLRWIILLVTFPIAIFYIYFTKSNLIPIVFLFIFTALINLFYLIWILKKQEYIHEIFSVSPYIDILITTFAISFTGWMNSPLFLLYFFILIDSCFDNISNKNIFFLSIFVFFNYFIVYIVSSKGILLSPYLFEFIVRIIFLIAIGMLGVSIANEMLNRQKEFKELTEEKEKLYSEIKRVNIALEEKVNRATENLEKTNLMLIKKNIALLATHEIYRMANEVKNKDELISMILSTTFPLMKGAGGIIMAVTPNKRYLHIECVKKVSDEYNINETENIEITAESEFYNVIINKKIYLIDDVTKVKDNFLRENIKFGSCILAPILAGDEVVEILIVFNKHPYIYNKNDIELIDILREQIGILLFNRVLFEQMKMKAAGLEKLMDVTISIETSIDIEELITKALTESIKKLFLNASGVVMLLTESNELKIRSQYGYKTRLLDTRIPTDSIAGWVFKNNKSLYIKDIKTIRFYNPTSDGLFMKDSVIISPIPSKGKIVGVISLTKQNELFTREDLYFLTILSNHIGSLIENSRLYANIQRDYINTIHSLAAAVDAKDHYTHGHSSTVMKYATKIAERMGLPSEEVETIKYAALLHDIGKIGISESIINKPGKLTKEEYNIIKMHPQLGANIVSKINSLKKLVPLILSHHEWVNGTGYPLGLKGDEIPLGARIISVVDAFSTITSKRPYRDELSVDFAIKEIKKCAGEQFDAKVVSVFEKIIEEETKDKDMKQEVKEEKKEKKRLRLHIDEDNKEKRIIREEDFYS
ncbi:MAG: HD domain-containing protein [Candidatus Goldbacteria bacterium]|nr:HD domain-containing protein [Candidatus Goldiibacteriota bacterium]